MNHSYTPDCWCVLEFTRGNITIRKVFAGWYGGFTEGDSWKLSSGITESTDVGDHWRFKNHSGSVYICYKNAHSTTSQMSNIFHRWTADAKEAGTYQVLDVSSEYVQQLC